MSRWHSLVTSTSLDNTSRTHAQSSVAHIRARTQSKIFRVELRKKSGEFDRAPSEKKFLKSSKPNKQKAQKQKNVLFYFLKTFTNFRNKNLAKISK